MGGAVDSKKQERQESEDSMKGTPTLNGVRVVSFSYAAPGHDGVPGRVVSNDELAEMLRQHGEQRIVEEKLTGEARELCLKNTTTNSAWIIENTHIQTRCFPPTGFGPEYLAVAAVQRALLGIGIDRQDIDGIYVASVTGKSSPPIFSSVAHDAGIGRMVKSGSRVIHGSDISAACSSFHRAFECAYHAITAGTCRKVFVVGVDTMPDLINWQLRDFSILLGAAGACFLLEQCPIEESAFPPNAFYSVVRGEGRGMIVERDWKLYMEGQKVFKAVIPFARSIILEGLAYAGIDIKDIKFLGLHQANGVMDDAITDLLRRKDDFSGNTFSNIERYGNTTSASIPLLCAEAHEEGILRPGMMVMLAAFGGGLTGGSVIFRWM